MDKAVLKPEFLGKPIEICIVSSDYIRTLTGLSNLGIGPWRIYTCSPATCTEQTYRGKPTPFSMRLCFADISPQSDIVYEVIQPLEGPTIFQDWLDNQGGKEGVHHIAYDCNNIPMEERVKMFEERGLRLAQSGHWGGDCRFAFFESEDTGTTFETIEFADGWEYQEPEEWFPAKGEDGGGAGT